MCLNGAQGGKQTEIWVANLVRGGRQAVCAFQPVRWIPQSRNNLEKLCSVGGGGLPLKGHILGLQLMLLCIGSSFQGTASTLLRKLVGGHIKVRKRSSRWLEEKRVAEPGCWILTVFVGLQQLRWTLGSIPRGGEAEDGRVVRGEFLQVGDGTAVDPVKVRRDGDGGHRLRGVDQPGQELERRKRISQVTQITSGGSHTRANTLGLPGAD